MQEARDVQYTETMKKVRNMLSDNVVTCDFTQGKDYSMFMCVDLIVILYFVVYALCPY